MRRKLYTTVEVAKAAGRASRDTAALDQNRKISAPPIRLRRNKAVRF